MIALRNGVARGQSRHAGVTNFIRCGIMKGNQNKQGAENKAILSGRAVQQETVKFSLSAGKYKNWMSLKKEHTDIKFQTSIW